jgi:hypothetical protein
MPDADIFALSKSSLNPFLFAVVGFETNGSALTVLSVLARLGHDPWIEAARWARLPKTALIDCLAESLIQMPLSPEALADVRLTASQLVSLLPADSRKLPQTRLDTIQASTVPRYTLMTLIFGALILMVAVNAIVLLVKNEFVSVPSGQMAEPAQSNNHTLLNPSGKFDSSATSTD